MFPLFGLVQVLPRPTDVNACYAGIAAALPNMRWQQVDSPATPLLALVLVAGGAE